MKIQNWIEAFTVANQPFLIAGPCSAESPEQLLSIAQSVKGLGVQIMRAGVWKPRTRPNSFEGKGAEAFQWMKSVKQETGILLATEVASPAHVELACEAEVDVLWIGARTSVNPFLVQEIAHALNGTDKIVLVKNPINPDLSLWIGALERIHKAGITKLGAVHRGFSSFQKSRFRNQPLWQIPLELKVNFPDVPLIADPSHIAGNRELIFEVSQKALDLDYNGLMIEVHPDPDHALSDAQQQITPQTLATLLAQLRVSDRSSSNAVFINQLVSLREKIDHIDQELVEMLALRARLTEQIGDYKKENQVTVFQLERWNEIMQTRPEWAQLKQLNPEFIRELYKIIHDESIRIQTEIMNKPAHPAGRESEN
jgi:chorismate mutase